MDAALRYRADAAALAASTAQEGVETEEEAPDAAEDQQNRYCEGAGDTWPLVLLGAAVHTKEQASEPWVVPQWDEFQGALEMLCVPLSGLHCLLHVAQG